MTAARLLAAGIALAAAALCFLVLPPLDALLFALFAGLAMLVTVTDLEQFMIPDTASLGILVLGTAFAILRPDSDITGGLLDAALRAAVAALVLYLLRLVYMRLTGLPGLGLGDVKLAAAAGPWLGWGMLPVALELAALAALLVIGFVSLRTGSRPERHAALPFGAFLAPAIWLCAFAEHGLGWAGIGLE